MSDIENPANAISPYIAAVLADGTENRLGTSTVVVAIRGTTIRFWLVGHSTDVAVVAVRSERDALIGVEPPLMIVPSNNSVLIGRIGFSPSSKLDEIAKREPPQRYAAIQGSVRQPICAVGIRIHLGPKRSVLVDGVGNEGSSEGVIVSTPLDKVASDIHGSVEVSMLNMEFVDQWGVYLRVRRASFKS